MNTFLAKLFLSYATLAAFFILWLYLMLNSFKHQVPVPWSFLLTIIGLFLWPVGIEMSLGVSIRIEVVWFFFGGFLYFNRQDLEKYFLSRHNILVSIFYGIILGMVMVIASFLFLDIKIIAGDVAQLSIGIIVTTIIKAAVGEELLFRSFTLGLLKQQGIRNRQANLLQSSLFLLIHFSRYLVIGYWPGLIFVMIMGILAGFITLKYENIAGAMVMHGIINLSSVIAVLIFSI